MTTTRYYLTDTVPGIAVARHSVWTMQSASSPLRSLVSVRPTSGTLAAGGAAETSTTQQRAMVFQGIGAPDLPARVMSGSYALAFNMSETITGADAFLHAIGRVVSADGLTVRGTLFNVTETLEAGTSASVRTMTGVLTPVTAQAGDRLVVEVGAFLANTFSLSSGVNLGGGNYGSMADLVATDGSTAAGVPWVELILDDPPNPPTGLTQTAATPTTVTVGWTAPATGTTPTSYEVRVNGGTPTDVGLVTSSTVTGLSAGTTYTIEVRAVAATGASTWASVAATTSAPPSPPTALTQTAATPTSLTVGWTPPATGASPTSYEVRVNGGTPTDVGLVTSHTVTGLLPVTGYTIEVRTVSTGAGTSSWATLVATTGEVSGDGLDLEAGHTFGTQLLDDTYSITVRRGLRSNGVTDDLEPATFTATIKGSDTLNPLTNDDVRPNRPWRLRATLDGTTWTNLATGKIQRARLEHNPDDKDDDTAYRLQLTGTDLVAQLTGIPSDVAVNGNLHQRVSGVLDPTGLPYVVEDPSSAGAGSTLPTDAKDVIGQLRLIRDTAHALMFVNRDGELVTVADAARPRVVTVPDWIATDEISTSGIHYTEVDPAFDTDRVVNILTVTLLDGADNPATVHTDDDSRTAWGDKPQALAVNDGVPETHADLYLASRVDPDLLPEVITFLVQERLPQAIEPTVNTTHLTAAIGVELYDVVRVVRAGMPTADLLVREITHTITPTAWRVTLGLRVPEVLATRWDDVPTDLTWDDVPPDLTWREARNWHPYLEGA